MKTLLGGTDPLIRHPKAVSAVILVGLVMHPSAVSIAFFGFAAAIIVSEAIIYTLRG